MLWKGANAQDSVTRIAVEVTFLRMDRMPDRAFVRLPDEVRIQKIISPDVELYRRLYNTAGAAYCWWLRRVMPDDELRRLMAKPGWALHVLYKGDVAQGFYELEQRAEEVNLSYFGLLPHAIGQNLGRGLLDAAIREAWSRQPSGLRVNTCNADHPRALGLYVQAGFKPQRTIREIWDIPDRLGLAVPDRLRV